jgi:hypothetical protein
MLGNLVFLFQPTEKTLDPNFVEKYHLTPQEQELIQYFRMRTYSQGDGNSGVRPLDEAYIQLIHNLNFLPQEIDLILSGRMSIYNAAALHGLSSFEARAKEDHGWREKAEEGEMYWPFSSGEYGKLHGKASRIYKTDISDDLWVQSRRVPENLPVGELLGVELTLADMMQQQLDQWRDGDQPLIMVDIGGMVGLSWFRLANHFSESIRAGKMAFVVTNLNIDSEEVLQRIGDKSYAMALHIRDTFYPGHSTISADDAQFISENRGLV